MTFREQLEALGVCPELMKWAGERDAETAWRECDDGSFMLWLIGKVAGGEVGSPERKKLVLAACECARLALAYAPAGEDAPRVVIETAERYARGEATLGEVRAANAVSMASASIATLTSCAVTRIACATCADERRFLISDAASNVASRVAICAAAAAADDAAAAAYIASLAASADIVRRHYPEPPAIPTNNQ